MRFPNRAKAGRALAEKLRAEPLVDPVVIALPRGGVVVGAALADALRAPLEVLAVRTLDAPSEPSLAFGAIAEGGALHLDPEAVRRLHVTPSQVDHVSRDAEREVERRVQVYRHGRALSELRGRTAIIADDGVITGNTALAAIAAVRAAGAARVVLAAPVMPAAALHAFTLQVDAVSCLRAPEHFGALAAWYDEFPEVTDPEVVALLEKARSRRRAELPIQSIAIPLEGDAIRADLTVPEQPRGLVLFAHGSGGGRENPRNRYIARRLQQAGLATLLLDLLTEREEAEDAVTGRLRFGVELLANRIEIATTWLDRQPLLRELPRGYFGVGTGAAAALIAAADQPDGVRAVVSRGGRPELASEARLAEVRAPTLFIVGGRDSDVLASNRTARSALRCASGLEVIPGATHLFEEPGALAAVADVAASWLEQHLLGAPRGERAPTPA